MNFIELKSKQEAEYKILLVTHLSEWQQFKKNEGMTRSKYGDIATDREIYFLSKKLTIA